MITLSNYKKHRHDRHQVYSLLRNLYGKGMGTGGSSNYCIIDTWGSLPFILTQEFARGMCAIFLVQTKFPLCKTPFLGRFIVNEGGFVHIHSAQAQLDFAVYYITLRM